MLFKWRDLAAVDEKNNAVLFPELWRTLEKKLIAWKPFKLFWSIYPVK